MGVVPISSTCGCGDAGCHECGDASQRELDVEAAAMRLRSEHLGTDFPDVAWQDATESERAAWQGSDGAQKHARFQPRSSARTASACGAIQRR